SATHPSLRNQGLSYRYPRGKSVNKTRIGTGSAPEGPDHSLFPPRGPHVNAASMTVAAAVSKEVAIDVEGHGGFWVAHAAADPNDIMALGNEQRCMRVTQRVKAHPRQLEAGAGISPSSGQAPWWCGLAVRLGEQQSIGIGLAEPHYQARLEQCAGGRAGPRPHWAEGTEYACRVWSWAPRTGVRFWSAQATARPGALPPRGQCPTAGAPTARQVAGR